VNVRFTKFKYKIKPKNEEKKRKAIDFSREEVKELFLASTCMMGIMMMIGQAALKARRRPRLLGIHRRRTWPAEFRLAS
jgi:hypothetical protein